MAPHGIADGSIGLAALVQVSAALPDNYFGFELPWAEDWWFDILDGVDPRMVRDGFIAVWGRPGLGVSFNERARARLGAGDEGFLD